MVIGVNARYLYAGIMDGIARYGWETTRRMIEAHPEHEYVIFFDRKINPAFQLGDHVKCVSLIPQARHPLLWKWWFDYSLTRAMKKHKVDVLYSPDGFLSKRTSVPTLLVSHDITYFHFPEYMKQDQISYYQKNVPQFHEIAKHIIAVSHSTKEDLIKHFGLEPKKITVAYNALPPGSPLGLTQKEKKNYFLYLGSLHPRKNIVNKLLAFDKMVELLKEKGYRGALPKFILAGKAAFNTQDIFDTHEKMKNKDMVSFLGAVSEEEKWTLLAEANCLCYISKWEGFGIPLLEAMHAGTPVITSDSGAQKEVGAEAALFANPGNIDDISQKMLDLYTNETLQEKLISKGQERVGDFNWDETAGIIYKELEKLLNN